MIKRIFVNIVFIVFFLLLIEVICFNMTKKENIEFKEIADRLQTNNTKNYETKYTILKDFNPIIFRKSSIIENSEKKPIILFGCSFAEGAGLSDENIPCSRLSKLTKRSCINKARGATGVQFMYYQLSKEDFYVKNPQADYIIYVFIHNHLSRLYNYKINPLIDMLNLRYEIKNGRLQEIKPVFKPFYSSYTVQRFLNAKVLQKTTKEEKDFMLFNAIMRENVKLIKEHYKNAKIIMLEYPERNGIMLPSKEIKTLENMGIKVVRVKDLVKNINIYDRKYWLSDTIHPSNSAWDIIMPEFTRKYIKD